MPNPVLPDGITLPNQSSPPVGEGGVFTKEWYLGLSGMAGKLNKIPAGSDHWVQINSAGLLGASVGFQYDPAMGAIIAGSSVLGVSYSLNLYDENASPGIAMFLGDANNLPGSGQLTAIWASDLFTAFGVANASAIPVMEQLQDGNLKVAGASTIGTIYPLNLYDSNSSPGIVLSDGDLSASTILAIWACDVNVAFGVVDDSGQVLLELMQTGKLQLAEVAAPSVSSAGFMAIYADSTTHKSYISQNGGAWVQFGGSEPFPDNTALIANFADPTKLLILDASLITTATTRTVGVQDANYILAGTNISNNFTVAQVFSSLTASLPVRSDGSKILVSGPIDLGVAGEVAITGVSAGQALGWSGSVVQGITGQTAVAIPLAKITGGGANGSITFTSGIMTAHTNPT